MVVYYNNWNFSKNNSEYLNFIQTTKIKVMSWAEFSEEVKKLAAYTNKNLISNLLAKKSKNWDNDQCWRFYSNKKFNIQKLKKL